MASSQTEEASAPDAAPAPAAMEKTSGADHIPIHTPDAPLPSYQESPVLAALVQAGELPPVAERLPDLPAVVTPTTASANMGARSRRLTGCTPTSATSPAT